MSQLKYCQGPICHEHKTKDRIRGSKGDKHYETRKRSHMYYNGNFCSLGCQDDWFRKFGNNAIDHFGRVTEAKRTDASNAHGIKIIDGIETIVEDVLVIIITSSMIYLASAYQLLNNNIKTRT